MSEDPEGVRASDANLYRYAHNSPTFRTDPFGLDDNGGWTDVGTPYWADTAIEIQSFWKEVPNSRKLKIMNGQPRLLVDFAEFKHSRVWETKFQKRQHPDPNFIKDLQQKIENLEKQAQTKDEEAAKANLLSAGFAAAAAAETLAAVPFVIGGLVPGFQCLEIAAAILLAHAALFGGLSAGFWVQSGIAAAQAVDLRKQEQQLKDQITSGKGVPMETKIFVVDGPRPKNGGKWSDPPQATGNVQTVNYDLDWYDYGRALISDTYLYRLPARAPASKSVMIPLAGLGGIGVLLP